jgi:hypothetical protein
MLRRKPKNQTSRRNPWNREPLMMDNCHVMVHEGITDFQKMRALLAV